MKLHFTTINLFLLVTMNTLFSATRTTIQSGNYSDVATWDCNCIPSPSDIVVLTDGVTLTIDSSVTISQFRYDFALNSAAASELIVDSTLTITGDFRFEEPSNSTAAALLTINSTGVLNIGGDLRFAPSSFENELTYTITVDGTMNLTDDIQHATGILSTDAVVNIDVSGTFNSDAWGFLFQASDSRLNLTISGTVTVGALTVDMNYTNSDIDINVENGGILSHRAMTMTTYRDNSDINIICQSGGQMPQNSNGTLRLDIRGEDSDVRISTADLIYFANYNITSQGDEDTIAISVLSGGTLRALNAITLRPYTGSNSHLDFDLANGGTVLHNTIFDIESAVGGTYNVNLSGTYTGGYHDFDFRTGSKGTITFGSNGIINATSSNYTLAGNGRLNFNQNGRFKVTGASVLYGVAGDTIDVTMDGPTSVGSTFQTSTLGDDSKLNIDLNDSLVVNTLRMDVNTTALSSQHVLDMSTSGAVLSVQSINLDNTVKDATIATAVDGSTTTLFRGSTTTSIPIRTTVEYDNLIVSNTSASGLTLDEGDLDNTNFHGDLSITSGATFDLNGSNSVTVQGDLTNSGTYNDNGSDLTVNGNFTNTLSFNNEGSDYTIGGDFINSGTFNTGTGSALMDITGSFTNVGTFDAEITTLNIGGDFGNSGNYTSTGGNDINVSGNWDNTNIYAFTDGDAVTFEGSATQEISGTTTFYDMVINNAAGVDVVSGTTSLQHLLDIQAGQFDSQGHVVFLSNASGTAMLGDLTSGGTITGDVTVQRYLNKGNNWYMLGSPVTGATLADWNVELPMSGFTGSDEPAHPFVSVYTFDDATRPINGFGFNSSPNDSGYVKATNITNSIDVGKGQFVYFQKVKPGKTAKTADLTGPLVSGSKSLSLKYACYETNLMNNGWNLISNPYASPVAWNQVTRNNIQNSGACYRLDSSGAYTPFVNGTVFSGEAVWVQASGSYLPPFNYNFGTVTTYNNTIVFNENDKVVAVDTFNQKSGGSVSEQPLVLALSYSGKPGYVDRSKIYVRDQSSVYYDMDYDARKIENAFGNVPNIASTTQNDTLHEKLIWNSIPNNDSIVIPITVWQKFPTNKVNSFKIDFEGIEEWSKNNKCLIMEDQLNNVTKKLDANDQDYTWSAMDSITKPYIYLNYTIPLDVTSQNVSCFGYNDGQVSVSSKGAGTHSYLWVDALNNVVKTEKNITGPSTANNLMPGQYTIWVSNNGVCGEVAATVEIKEPEPIIADFSSDLDTVYLKTNSTIYFTNSSINADEYHWDFGDGSTSQLESPSHTYLKGGEFTVKMMAIDGDCSDTLSKTIVVVDNVGIENAVAQNRKPIEIYQMGDDTYVEFNFETATNASIYVFDVLGKQVISPEQVSQVTTRKMRLDIPESAFGVYTVSVVTDQEKVAKKLYFTRK